MLLKSVLTFFHDGDTSFNFWSRKCGYLLVVIHFIVINHFSMVIIDNIFHFDGCFFQYVG